MHLFECGLGCQPEAVRFLLSQLDIVAGGFSFQFCGLDILTVGLRLKARRLRVQPRRLRPQPSGIRLLCRGGDAHLRVGHGVLELVVVCPDLGQCGLELLNSAERLVSPGLPLGPKLRFGAQRGSVARVRLAHDLQLGEDRLESLFEFCNSLGRLHRDCLRVTRLLDQPRQFLKRRARVDQQALQLQHPVPSRGERLSEPLNATVLVGTLRIGHLGCWVLCGSAVVSALGCVLWLDWAIVGRRVCAVRLSGIIAPKVTIRPLRCTTQLDQARALAPCDSGVAHRCCDATDRQWLPIGTVDREAPRCERRTVLVGLDRVLALELLGAVCAAVCESWVVNGLAGPQVGVGQTTDLELVHPELLGVPGVDVQIAPFKVLDPDKRRTVRDQRCEQLSDSGRAGQSGCGSPGRRLINRKLERHAASPPLATDFLRR